MKIKKTYICDHCNTKFDNLIDCQQHETICGQRPVPKYHDGDIVFGDPGNGIDFFNPCQIVGEGMVWNGCVEYQFHVLNNETLEVERTKDENGAPFIVDENDIIRAYNQEDIKKTLKDVQIFSNSLTCINKEHSILFNGNGDICLTLLFETNPLN